MTSQFVTTIFPSMAAQTCEVREFTLETLAEFVASQHAYEKSLLPWIKLAKFGEKRSAHGSLRHESNMTVLTGVVADYDGEQIAVSEAAFRLQHNNILGLIYSSPSHHPDRPRWRVVCPLTIPHPLGAHDMLMDRLNGIMGGCLAPESWVLAQCYYAGQVNGGAPVETEIVHGETLDNSYHLDAIAIPRPEGKRTHNAGDVNIGGAEIHTVQKGSLGLTTQIDDGRETYMRSLVMAHFCEFVAENGTTPTPQELFESVWPIYSRNTDLSRAGRGANEVAAKCQYILKRFEAGELRHAGRLLPDLDAVVASHRTHQAETVTPQPRVIPMKPGGLRVVNFTELLTEEVVEEPDFIEPDFVGPGGFVLIAGPPKAQKSFLLQDILVAAATGGGFLNHYKAARPLRVFWLQAEMNRKLLRRRAKAMSFLSDDQKRLAAENMFISERFYMLLDENGVNLAIDTIRSVFPDAPPDIIAIDPLANLFSGDNENDNTQLMGFLTQRVEAVRRAINPEAAVMMVHHATKKSVDDLERDPFLAIRGAGALRGYYDTGIIMFKKSEQGTERRVFIETRNGEPPEPMTVTLQAGRFVTAEQMDGVNRSMAVQIWNDMLMRWNKGQGVSLQPQTRRTGRYAPAIYGKEFGIPPRHVSQLIEGWLSNGVCVVEPISKKDKSLGIKPVMRLDTVEVVK